MMLASIMSGSPRLTVPQLEWVLRRECHSQMHRVCRRR